MRISTKKTWMISVTAVSTVAFATGLWPGVSEAYELRAAFAPECPTTKFPGTEGLSESPAIAATIVTSLATSFVDTGVAALKKAVNPGNATLEAQFLEQGLYMYKGEAEAPATPDAAASGMPSASSSKASVKPNSKMGCLVVASGTFTSAKEGVLGWKLPFASDRPQPPDEDNTSANRRVADALGLRGPATLSIYLEAARVFSGDRTAVTWKPVRLYVGEYLNDSFWAGKERSTSIEMRLYKPGKTEAFYAQVFAFAAVSKPLDKNAADLAFANVGTWNVLPANPTLPANFGPTKEGRAFDPYTLEVRIVEAPKPYALAQAFADIVDKNKDAIKKEVTQTLNPDSAANAAAALTAEGATLDAINGYLTALKAATTDCAADKVRDDAGKLNCSILRDKASVAMKKADLACKSSSVSSCISMPKIPDAPA
jgi:hypothetical protein